MKNLLLKRIITWIEKFMCMAFFYKYLYYV